MATSDPVIEVVSDAQPNIDGDDALVAVLYVLMRDHLPTGVLAGLVRDYEKIGAVEPKEWPMPGAPAVRMLGEQFVRRARYPNEDLARMATGYARRLRAYDTIRATLKAGEQPTEVST